ncbi:hypothetical protein [Phenylobacterium sp.]|uniref:hypothetical protein n=1 Tax=Phenylobacterium sp. TaxID=1871053 RepID=UPI00272F7F2C|nr:hypothetical protein [Phenylobacterium sp.]MDP1875673.1 hypothetical protein [Phenylobacterium sp.]
MSDKLMAQTSEFAAAEHLAAQLRRCGMTAVVDDDYPRVRAAYEGALASFLTALANNGRFEPGNRYGLKPSTVEAGGDAAVDAFLAEVRAELIRARAKFPGDRIMTIALAEEFGELAKAILDEPTANVRKEAVQTAVMAARVVLDGDGSVTEWRAARGLDPLVTP